MDFKESAALDVIAVRAVETADRTRALWTDADRAWASRAASEVVGQDGTPQSFLAQRAQLALGRMGERLKAVPRAARSLQWRPWVGMSIVAGGFVAGVLIDRIGGTQRINVLAPPVLLLLGWNLAMYVVCAVWLARHGDAGPSGPLRRFVIWIARGRVTPRGELRAALSQLAGQWSQLSGPLYRARAARVLHLSAAAFAAGVVTGLYVRGVAFEYQATWESTFLDADRVHALLALALAPGSMLTGISVPTVSEVAAIRAPSGENAARWLHLMAATVAIIVIVPRLLLALIAWLLERSRATHLTLALEEPYFQRLLRGFRNVATSVRVIPHSYTLSSIAVAGLRRLVARVLGENAALTIAAPVGYGSSDAYPGGSQPEQVGIVIALFNATATPEREVHGNFLSALAAGIGAATPLVALVDESTFQARWNDEHERLQARRLSWRELCDDRRAACVFVDLAASDVDEPAALLENALTGPDR